MTTRKQLFCLFVWGMSHITAPPLGASPMSLHPVTLRCEYVVNPLGVDTSSPHLSWTLESTRRGERQTAYEVLVSDSASHLWDSGKVASDKMNQTTYAGKPLRSAQQVVWKVRVWNKDGRASPWSAPAHWTMGLLSRADWHGAQWVGAETAAEGSGGGAAAGAGLIGYHAAEATNQDDVKWVQVDLGKPYPLSMVRLYPMQHAGKDGFGFPLRFRVEAANDSDFQQLVMLTDQTAADYPNPGVTPVAFKVNAVTARYVRVTATKLWLRNASVTGTAAYAFALHRLEVDSGGRDVAASAAVSAKDAVQSSEWGKAALTAFAPVPSGMTQTDSLLLRRAFTVRPRLTRAVAFVCGLGQYEMTLNGAKVGDAVMTPGWTKYDKTCLYDTYDITASLRPGPNAVGLMLGNGFYNVHPGRYTKITCSFGPQRAIAVLRLEYADGSVQDVVTDEHWKASPGPITFSSIYGGEAYDARLLPTGWDQPGFRDAAWHTPTITPGPGGALKGLSGAAPPIRVFQTFAPVSSKTLRPGVTVYDLGQNASLMLRLRVRGPAGSSVKVTPSELVHDNGDINDTMCNGDSYWTYTLSGHGEETYLSKFYYRGGRYLKVELQPAAGSADLPVVEGLAGEAIRAASPAVGQFSCSNAMYNKVFDLVRWSQINNTVSVMTDCPTREKLGWLEEDHLNGPSLRYNFDMTTMMSKMVNDMTDSQRDDGLVPSTCPDFPRWGEGEYTNPPEWGSACIAVPCQQFEFTGDIGLLRRHYDTMKRYVDYLTGRAQNHIVSFGLGDWYDNHSFGAATLTPIGITATAFYFYDSQKLAEIASVLGKADDAAHYAQQSQDILAAYNQKYFNAATNNYATGSQASNAFPLGMGMVGAAARPAVLANLAQDLQSKGPTVGEVGMKYLFRSLADGGRSDVLDTTFNTDTQGYGLQVKQGKTTLTEGWNGGASQDHFMFGQINEWFYHDLAGIQDDPSGPGFTKIIIKPAIVAGLTQAGATYDSVSGRIASSWHHEAGKVTMDVFIPANTTATVYVLASDPRSVTESGVPAAHAPGVTFLRSEGGACLYRVGSGHYTFMSTNPIQ